MPVQVRRGNKGLRTRQGVMSISSRSFSWLLKQGLAGIMSSWPSWQNLVKVINRAAFPWVSSVVGPWKRMKRLSVPRASDSLWASPEATLRAFPGGAGLYPCLESVLHDLDLGIPTVPVCPGLGRAFPEENKQTRKVPGKLTLYHALH